MLETMDDRCFICGSRIGRGNQPALDVHERMNKLVSVSQTVEHSSTIISDILSRILNETVMREETICRICFNLLNDIDYHLKEAQEKTDEITNKFLDKGKDPLSYHPQPIVTACARDEDMLDLDDRADKRFPFKKAQWRNSASRRNPFGKKKNAYDKGGRIMMDSEDPLTEDEMSVNIINKNKQKLLSHVLNPSKKIKQHNEDHRLLDPDEDKEKENVQDESEEEAEDKEEEEEEEEDISDSENEYVPKSARTKKSNAEKHSTQRKLRNNSSRTQRSATKSKGPTADLTTVNMEDLDDILCKPKIFFAKKSQPPASSSAPLDDIHDDGGSFACEKCSRTFKKHSNLQLHMEKMHSSEAAVFSLDEAHIPETHKCQLCPREFTNERSLASHRDEHQADELEKKPVTVNVKVVKPAVDAEVKATCNICNKTFRRHFNLRIHIDRVHNKVKPFGCDQCEKSFATNSDLRQHMTVHGQGKVFSCEECGREFSNRDSIILHRKQHTNQRTHFCMVCDKGFFKASCLNRHMRTHTGDRPYKCSHCSKGFSQSTTLKIHKSKCPKNPNASAAFSI